MINTMKLSTLGLVLGITLISAAPVSAQGQRGGPPPEAFEACEGKSSGASCSVEGREETISGTCQADRKDSSKTLCVPEGGPPKGDKNGGPKEGR